MAYREVERVAGDVRSGANRLRRIRPGLADYLDAKARHFDQIAEMERRSDGISLLPGRPETITRGGKTPQELEYELRKNGVDVFDSAIDLIRSSQFTYSKKAEEMYLRHLSVGNLEGPEEGLTWFEISQRASDYGLSLCPAEIGPHYMLQNKDQIGTQTAYIAMEPIEDSQGMSNIFSMGVNRDGFWLGSNIQFHGELWESHQELIFLDPTPVRAEKPLAKAEARYREFLPPPKKLTSK